MHACEKEKEKEDGLLIFGDRSRGNLGNNVGATMARRGLTHLDNIIS